MTSVSATELAKLGKCEALVIPRQSFRKPGQRNRVSSVIDSTVNKKNQAAINRGYAAHDRFEREAKLCEAKLFASKECKNRTIAPNLVLALAITAGLLTLLSAAAT